MKITKFLKDIWSYATKFLSNDNTVKNNEAKVQAVTRNPEYDKLFKNFILGGYVDKAQEMINLGYTINDEMQTIVNKSFLRGLTVEYFNVDSSFVRDDDYKVMDGDNTFYMKINTFFLKNKMVNMDTLMMFSGFNQMLNDNFIKTLSYSEDIMGKVPAYSTLELDRAVTSCGLSALEWKIKRFESYNAHVNVFMRCLPGRLGYVGSMQEFCSHKQIDSETFFEGLLNYSFDPDEHIHNTSDESVSLLKKNVLFYEFMFPQIISILVENKGVEPADLVNMVINKKNYKSYSSNLEYYDQLPTLAVQIFRMYPNEVIDKISEDDLIKLRDLTNNYIKSAVNRFGDANSNFTDQITDILNKKELNYSVSLLEKFKQDYVKIDNSYVSLAKVMDLPPELIQRLSDIKNKVELLKDKDIDIEYNSFLNASEKAISKILEGFKELKELDPNMDMKTYLLVPIMEIDKKVQQIDLHYQESQIESLYQNQKVSKVRMKN